MDTDWREYKRIGAITGWKYKYILEVNPRSLGAWIVRVRRELKRHL